MYEVVVLVIVDSRGFIGALKVVLKLVEFSSFIFLFSAFCLFFCHSDTHNQNIKLWYMFDKLQAFMISLSISFTSHNSSLVYFIHRKSFDNGTLLYQVYAVFEYNFYDFNNSKLACFVQIHITCPLFSLTSLTFGLKVRHSWVLEIVCDWNIIYIDLGEDNTWLAGLKHILSHVTFSIILT